MMVVMIKGLFKIHFPSSKTYIIFLFVEPLFCIQIFSGSAHIWQCSVNLLDESSSGRVASSEDELDSIQTRETQVHGFPTPLSSRHCSDKEYGTCSEEAVEVINSWHKITKALK